MTHFITAIGLTSGGSSTVHIYTKSNTTKQNIQNGTRMTIRISKLTKEYIT